MAPSGPAPSPSPGPAPSPSPAARPLEGISVVVTRPRSSGDELNGVLAAAGARVLWVPAIEVHDPVDGGAALRGALTAPGHYDWIVFTSVHAVHALHRVVRDVRALAGVQLAAVGGATAAALAGYGLEADLVPARAHAAALVEAFATPDATPDATPPPAHAPAAGERPRRVLFPCAQGARPTLPAGLRAKGWVVDEVVAYRTVPAPPPPASMLGTLSDAVAIVFSSPSAVHAYLDARVVETGSALPMPPVVVCGGPTTATAARAAGLEVAAQSQGPSPVALVHSLVTLVGSGAAGTDAKAVAKPPAVPGTPARRPAPGRP